jgi:glutamate/tyrosine decarboxylase-like PLP-dependent enzyme
LIRDAAAHRRSFEAEAAYLRRLPRGTTAADWAFHMLGPELSRGFRGLPVWMTMRHFGLTHLARVVEQNIEQAAYLAKRVRGEPELELLDEPPLNIVCFRFRGAGRPEAELDAINAEILVRLQEEGTAVPNPALVRGRSGLRCAIVNHRTRRADLDLLVAATLRLGRQLEAAAPWQDSSPA